MQCTHECSIQHFVSILSALISSVFLFPPLQVAGERYVYKFVCEPEALFSLAFPDNQRPSLKAEFEWHVSEEDTVPLSHLDEGVAYLQDLGGHPYGKGYTY